MDRGSCGPAHDVTIGGGGGFNLSGFYFYKRFIDGLNLTFMEFGFGVPRLRQSFQERL